MIARLGPLIIELKGSGKLFDLICTELKASEFGNRNDAPDLEIHLIDEEACSSFTPSIHAVKQQLSFNSDSFFRALPVSHLVKHLFAADKPCSIHIFHNPNNLSARLKYYYRTLIHMNEPSHLAIMSDPLFWSVCQILFVKLRCSYFHASVVVNKEGEAIAFMGTGGAGKTSTLFKLLEEPNYKYLADDYGMISEDSTVFFTSSMVTIYREDVKDGQGIKHAFLRRGFSASQRLKWALISKLWRNNAWLRVSVHDLLPESQINNAARLARVLHLIRANIKEPQALPLSKADLVLRMLNGSLRGMNHTLEFLRLIHANSVGDSNFMTESHIQQGMIEIYQQALMNVEGHIVLLPLEIDADKIVQFLKQEELV